MRQIQAARPCKNISISEARQVKPILIQITVLAAICCGLTLYRFGISAFDLYIMTQMETPNDAAAQQIILCVLWAVYSIICAVTMLAAAITVNRG